MDMRLDKSDWLTAKHLRFTQHTSEPPAKAGKGGCSGDDGGGGGGGGGDGGGDDGVGDGGDGGGGDGDDGGGDGDGGDGYEDDGDGEDGGGGDGDGGDGGGGGGDSGGGEERSKHLSPSNTENSENHLNYFLFVFKLQGLHANMVEKALHLDGIWVHLVEFLAHHVQNKAQALRITDL